MNAFKSKKHTETKITILGTGAMASAMMKVLSDAGHMNIWMYGVDAHEVKDLAQGKNSKYFGTTQFPIISVTSDLKEAISGADYIVIAVPSKVVGDLINKFDSMINKKCLIINVAKGFFPGMQISLHEGIEKTFAKTNKFVQGVVSLIGPSFAAEIVKGYPTTIAAVSHSKKHCEEASELFTNDYFKLYGQTDVVGAEVGATYKNILAIASGICEGMKYGINTRTALLTRGIVEMARFNKFMKGDTMTIYGLTGIGDLLLTATSDQSRNFTFGRQFAVEGHAALKNNVATVEGIEGLKNVYQIMKTSGGKLDLPIVKALYDAIFNEVPLQEAITSLWTREFKFE